MKRIWTRIASFLSAVSVVLTGVGLAGAEVAITASSVIDESDAYVEAGVPPIGSRLWELISGSGATETASGERIYLIPGGSVFGARIKEMRVTVSTADENGVLAEGDKILSIDDEEITSIYDIKEALKGCDGSTLHVKVLRAGKQLTLDLTPKQVGDEYKLGAVLREGAAGIGTVTYIDPKTGEFGGLGHGICDADSGEVINTTGGAVTGVILGAVVRGESGKPGELTGILTDKKNGEIYSNTECGVFGTLSDIPKNAGTPMPIAYRSEVHPGEAKIISTLKNGTTMEYSVNISEVNHASTGTKSFKITVTDKVLLAISGGIVRGMSGSPIIQDGKLVGAVTHVMVANPTEGYGIFIENMLNAANIPMAKAS